MRDDGKTAGSGMGDDVGDNKKEEFCLWHADSGAEEHGWGWRVDLEFRGQVFTEGLNVRCRDDEHLESGVKATGRDEMSKDNGGGLRSKTWTHPNEIKF